LPPGPTGKVRADGAREKFLRGATAVQELIEPMITGEPYPIKGLFLYGINLFHTVPNVPRTKEALKKLDLVAAIDVLPQDHIAWADVVFPEATFLERYDELWACSHKTPYIALREPAIKPLYDTKPGWWIGRELGLRLGLKKYYRWESAEEYLDERLSTVGLSVAKLREQGGVAVQKGKPYLEEFEAEGKSPFNTPSKKVELYAESLALSGAKPLPEYEPVAEPPKGYYRLLYGRSPVHTFAKTQNTPLLNELMSENEVWLNAEVAREEGLASGDRVWL
jgi:thiosulfate reductase/polysulfide reductase chain A